MSRMLLLSALLCVSWISAVCVADEVYLVNGDRITGKVTTLADGKLTVESDLAGKLTIDLNNVTTFKTNEPVEIQLKDGTAFKKQISKAETGRFAVEGDQTLKSQDFNVASIVVINPPVKEAAEMARRYIRRTRQHARQHEYTFGKLERQSDQEKRNRPDAAVL